MSEHVRLMFSDISGSYDLGNDVLSGGMHRSWKRRFVKMTRPQQGSRVLDVATGTGDIASLYARKVGAKGEVVGVDFSGAMIDVARKRAKNSFPNLRFEVGDVLDLRFDDDTFDIASISFGIRNVDDPEAGLAEMRRVVKPGGRVAVMEFPPAPAWIAALPAAFSGGSTGSIPAEFFPLSAASSAATRRPTAIWSGLRPSSRAVRILWR